MRRALHGLLVACSGQPEVPSAPDLDNRPSTHTPPTKNPAGYPAGVYIQATWSFSFRSTFQPVLLFLIQRHCAPWRGRALADGHRDLGRLATPDHLHLWPRRLGLSCAIALSSAVVSEITWLSTDTSTSPGFTPALSAGPPWTTAAISAPSLASSPNDSAISGVRSLRLHADPAARDRARRR